MSRRKIQKKPVEKIKNVLSYHDSMSLINDMFLSNFLDKNNGHAELVDIEQLQRWKRYFSKIDGFDINQISSKYYYQQYKDILNYKDIEEVLQNDYPIVYKILELAEGHISLCGGAVLDILHDKAPNDFDLFFHGLNIEQTEELLEKCLKCIKDSRNGDSVSYRRSAGVITAEFYANRQNEIQFIRRIYQTKDQVLLGFDLSVCRSGYNPYDGFFTTIDGGFALAMKAFPLDLTQRSTSHGHRLNKYADKGFKILLPGLPAQFHQDLETPDGQLFYDREKGRDFAFSPTRYDKTDYGDDEDQHWMNWWYIKEEKYYKFVIETNNYEDILSLSNEIIKTNIASKWNPDPDYEQFPRHPQTSRDFMGDDYKEFAMAYYVENDLEIAQQLWDKRLDYYLSKLKEYIDLNSWRYENPGGQNFGKFNPIIADPHEWYGQYYQTVEVGLATKRVAAFRKLRHQGYPTEILDNICDFWLASEVYAARQRLFALQ